MSLIICTECGKEFSDKAAACPQCGCPPQSDAAIAGQMPYWRPENHGNAKQISNNEMPNAAFPNTGIPNGGMPVGGNPSIQSGNYNAGQSLSNANMNGQYNATGMNGQLNPNGMNGYPNRAYNPNPMMNGMSNGYQNTQGNMYNANPTNNYGSTYAYNSNTKTEKKKDSTLSIWAAVLGFFTCTTIVGFIVAIIDLVKNKNDGKRHLGSYFAIVMFALWVIVGIASHRVGKNEDNKTSTSSENKVVTEQTTEKKETESLIDTADDKTTMKVGDVTEVDDLYVGLAHVKRTPHSTNALGEIEEISSDHEVIYAFYEVYNASDNIKTPSTSDFSCYVDGVKVEDVDSYFLFEEDGVKELNSYQIDGGRETLMAVNFEVSKNWEEIKLYYKSGNIWCFGQDEIKENSYDGSFLYNVSDETPTNKEGDVVYSGDSEIIFDGYEFYTYDNVVWGPEKYVVFKYTVTNNSEEALDYTLIGYNMRGYQDNRLLDSATFTMTDKIGDYINVYDVDEIQSGMSSKMYVAFPIKSGDGKFTMVYDQGYIISDVLATISAN